MPTAHPASRISRVQSSQRARRAVDQVLQKCLADDHAHELHARTQHPLCQLCQASSDDRPDDLRSDR